MTTPIILLVFILSIALWVAFRIKSDKSPWLLKRKKNYNLNKPSGPPVYLDRIFASTSKNPNRIQHVLSESNKDYWSSMPGAGPGEYILLEFGGPADIHELIIEQAENKNLILFEEVEVWVNQKFQGSFSASNSIPISAMVQKLKIRILETGMAKIGKPENAGSIDNLPTFPDYLSVSIGRLVFKDKHGRILNIQAPEIIWGRIMASSVSPPENVYSPARIFSAQVGQAWISQTNSVDSKETLTIKFNQTQSVSGFKLWNGYQRSSLDFQNFGRISKMAFGTDAEHFEFDCQDFPGSQIFLIPSAIRGKVFDLNILKQYPGRKSKSVAVSGLVFYDGDQPLIVHSTDEENLRQDLLKEIDQTILDLLVDRRIGNKLEKSTNGFASNRTLTLRSDYSFQYTPGTEKIKGIEYPGKTIAIGFWEIQELGSDHAGIKLSGVLLFFTKNGNIPEWKDDGSTGEFEEHLDISYRTIKGSKDFPPFFF